MITRIPTRLRISFLPVLAVLLLAGCNITGSEEFIPEYIVESYLFSGEPFQPIRLSRTVPVGAAYIFEEQAVAGATVTVFLLSPNGSVQDSLSFRERLRSPGVYYPLDTTRIVQPLTAYALEARIPDDDALLSARTVTPDSFSIRSISADTVVFQASPRLEVIVTRSNYPGRQNIFVLSAEALDPRMEQLTPFIAAIFDEDTDELEDYRINESPPFNEENYIFNPDGTITIDIPWIAFNFFGPNRVFLYVIDDNIFDLMRSQMLQTHPSSLSPGEIPAIIEHIDGGTGIFGSYARVELEVFVGRL